MFLLAACVACLAYATAAPAVEVSGPCYYDGRTYNKGETIMIAHCMATMECLGDNNYGNMVSLGGVCPDKRAIDGQSGCLYDGRVYGAGETIIIQPCLAEMTCDGHNSYSKLLSLGGVCRNVKRETNGQTGCLYDGRVYAVGEEITVGNCLSKLTCLGNNNLSTPVLLGGQC